MKTKALNLSGLLIIISLILTNTASAQPNTQLPVSQRLHVAQVFTSSSMKDAIHTSDGNVSILVQLSQAPVALYQGGVAGLKATDPSKLGVNKLKASSPDSLAYAAYLQGVQQNFVNQVKQLAPGATVNFTYQVAFNGLSMTIDPAKVDALSKLPGVLKVYPNQIRYATMDASLPLINAMSLWTKLGGESKAGQGVKIADVDTGLDVANPMFSGTGFTAPVGYPKGFCATNPTDTTFQCNGKVIAGRVFVDPSLPISTHELATPADVDGHGSHTAGTASGDQVTVSAGSIVPVDTVISGVAPAAYLMVYKALFETPTNDGGYGTDASLIAGLDAALADGADVINNSWGGGAGGDPATNPEKPAIDAITAAGTLVVFAAGNDGPSAGTIGCPGCVESALTVAASTTNRIFGNQVDITGPGTVPASLVGLAGVQGSGTKLASDTTAPIKYDATNSLGCAAYSAGEFTSAVALIMRGTCTFATKVTDAADAGAIAVVVVNNAGGPPVSMSGLDAITTPALMLDQTTGKAVRDWVVANPTATVKLYAAVTRQTNVAWQDVMAGFSSEGPNGDPDVLKPDITAPGVNILSAFSPLLTGGSEPLFEFLQGTSMATPHITGSAALVMQLHPDWTPIQVKTALTSTSVQTLKKPDGITPADPFNMGAGRVDLARVSNAGLTFVAPSFANGNCIIICSWTNTLKNVTTTTETWTASVVTSGGLVVTVSPATVTLAPGYSADFTVSADPTGMDSGNTAFGSITWMDKSKTYTNAYMPIAVTAGLSLNASVLTKTVDKSDAKNLDTLTYTLTAGNGFTDDGKFFLTDKLPANLTYVPGSASAGLTYDDTSKTLTASAPIAKVVADVAPTGNPTIYTPHSFDPMNDFSISDLCTSPCDDEAFTITGVDYWFLGVHYNSIGVSSNGILTVGGATNATATSGVFLLPNTSQPTGVIAPLWGDLVMKGDDPHDTATGLWYIWGDATHTVFEWQGAQSFENPVDTYTFQVWFTNGTNTITIAYGDLSGSLTDHAFTVGMDNLAGTAGSTYYASDGIGDTIGTTPAVGTDLAVNNTFNTVTFIYKATIINIDLSKPFVYNSVDMKNNLNVDDPVAAARTSVMVYTNFLPITGK